VVDGGAGGPALSPRRTLEEEDEEEGEGAEAEAEERHVVRQLVVLDEDVAAAAV
jgi:hypothetical protein